MATAEMTMTEIESTMGTIKKMIVLGAAFVVIGYALIGLAGLQEAFDIASALDEDSTKMWLKLGGVGHVLVGIFVSLVAIIRTLSLVPHRLSLAMD
jgi:hypothetical protein